MTNRTRVFLFTAAGVLVAALATGLVAWASGLSAIGSSSPDELAYVPRDAQMVAFADVRQLMNSPLHDRFRQFETTRPSGPDSLEARTGIKFDTDIDRVLIASNKASDAPASSVSRFPKPPGVGAVSDSFGVQQSLIVARGRFDVVRIEGLMRQQGAEVEQYRGKRVVAIEDGANGAHNIALTFAEPGLLLFGPREMVRGALDAKTGAAQGISANSEFMSLVDGVDEGTAWTVAKFDAVSGRSPVPGAIVSQLPPINWLAASGRVDSGVHGLVRAEAKDEDSARNLRDVVQGFLSFARLQASRDPAYKATLDSVALSAEGKSVSLSFELTPAALDLLSSAPLTPRSGSPSGSRGIPR